MEAAVAQIPAVALEAEESVLGALMVRPAVDAVVAETGLAPEHFYRERHRHIFAAILALNERGAGIDSATVTGEVRGRGHLAQVGGPGAISHLASSVVGAHNVLTYARRVVEEAQWRARERGAQAALEAVRRRDDGALADAEAALRGDLVQADWMVDVDAQLDRLAALADGEAKADFVYPFDKLNRLSHGGMRRKHLIVVSGYTHTGKSFIADAILDTNKKHGHRVALYKNEMSVEERVARRAARMRGVNYGRLTAGNLEPRDAQKLLDHANNDHAFLWPIFEIEGRSAAEVAASIRRWRWDLVVIDILHNFAYDNERDLSAIVQTFKAAGGLADCCIVLVAHVNRRGATETQGLRRRKPGLHDLRGSGDIENLADVVMFLHRDQDPDTDELAEDGFVYFAKCRGGKLGAVKVHFNAERLRFEVAGV